MLHVDVVHDHAEVVGRDAVARAGSRGRRARRWRPMIGPFTRSFERDLALVRIAEADDRLRARRRRQARGLRALGPPAPVVARLLAARALLLAQRVELLARRVAVVGAAARDQLLGDCRGSAPAAPSGSTGLRSRGPATPWPARIACTDSSVERSRSVSSTRRMNVPPCFFVYAQQKSAVRAPPMCR